MERMDASVVIRTGLGLGIFLGATWFYWWMQFRI